MVGSYSVEVQRYCTTTSLHFNKIMKAQKALIIWISREANEVLLKTKTVGKDGKLTKTAIIPFSSIACIECEYETNDETGKEEAEMCIRFNSNCPDINIRDKDISHFVSEIFDDEDKDIGGGYGFYESESIKDLYDQMVDSMNKYIEKTQIRDSMYP
ncbi:MAG: hypothetical protein NT038_09605 [Euryarchaeota archaeon]|nr:hypothetical protein [Euryarchaeota archaeon]